jgi:hypothetical protein
MNANPLIMAAFWQSNTHLGYKERPQQGKNQGFMIFDILARAGLVVSVGVMLFGFLDINT